MGENDLDSASRELAVSPGIEGSLSRPQNQERDKAIFRQIVAKLGEPDAYSIPDPTGLTLPPPRDRSVDARLSDFQSSITTDQQLELGLKESYYIPDDYPTAGLRVIVKKPIPEGYGDAEEWDDPEIWRRTSPWVVVEGEIFSSSKQYTTVRSDSDKTTIRAIMLNSEGQTFVAEQYQERLVKDGRIVMTVGQSMKSVNGPIEMDPDFWPKIAKLVSSNPKARIFNPFARQKPWDWEIRRRWSYLRPYLRRKSDSKPRLTGKS